VPQDGEEPGHSMARFLIEIFQSIVETFSKAWYTTERRGDAAMKVLKIYLESTLFNYYIDEDRDAHADTVTLFEECAAGKFEPYTSTYAIEELDDAPAEKREKMLDIITRYSITVLAATEETNDLAKRYIAEGALPSGSLTDASHIAITAVNGLDMIVSLNFRHIVREKTIQITGAINTILGYDRVKIKSPMEVIDSEKTRYHLGRGSCDTPQD
jgi:predicted nucleic acid-binding protein